MTGATPQLMAIYDRQRAAVYALCVAWAGYALAEFREKQPNGSGNGGAYWDNQTGVAAAEVFSDAFIDGEDLGWFISHAVEYGVYLELANNRQNESLRPIVMEQFPKFMDAVKAIYAAAV